MDLEKLYKVQYTIEDTLKILDSAPVHRDLVQDVNLVQLANRAPIAHINIEKGIKALIAKVGKQPTDKNSHDLEKLLRDLKIHDKKAADFFSTAFDDAVNCFGINTRFRQFRHLTCLEKYLSKAGTEHVFQELRYWSLGESEEVDLFRFIVLPIHRELLYALWCFFSDDNPHPEPVSNRVEREIQQVVYRDLVGRSEDAKKEELIRWYTDWINEPRSFRDALREVTKDMVIPEDDVFTQTLRNAFGMLRESKDAAVRHFIQTLSYIPRGSQKGNPGAIPEMDWRNKFRSKGEVKTPGGSHLGFIEQYADKSWGINAIDGFSGVSEISESLKDAQNFLVNHLSERVIFEVNGEEKHLRIVKKLVYERDAVSYSREIRPLERMHDLELWDNNHGLNPGDVIVVRLPFKGEERRIRYILRGQVEVVSGSKVSVLGTGGHGFSLETEDDGADSEE